jgi:hypothetical protein
VVLSKSQWRITSQNQKKLFFLALNLLVYFRKSLHKISAESFFFEKLFDSHAGFNEESQAYE